MIAIQEHAEQCYRKELELMNDELWNRLKISEDQLGRINTLLLDPDTRVITDFLKVIEKHGTVDEINAKAREARKLSSLMGRLKEGNSPYLADLEWLMEQRDREAFVSIADFRRSVLGDRADAMTFKDVCRMNISEKTIATLKLIIPITSSRAATPMMVEDTSPLALYSCTTAKVADGSVGEASEAIKRLAGIYTENHDAFSR